MKVLVTGGAGYMGSILCKNLLERGYDVICLDKLFFGDVGIKDLLKEERFKLVKDDTRYFDPSLLENIDIVVDLAAISQPDPNKKINPKKFYEINFFAPTRVAKLSKKYSVKRYVFASTCSVYGFQDEILNENSNLSPLEEYGKNKAMAEREILQLSNKKFCVTILRFATLYGYSKKMRFDLVVNGMTLSLFKQKRVMVMRPGTQWRPVVHVKDATKAIIKVIDANNEKVNGEVFNVGSNEQNFQIYKLAKIIGDSVKEQNKEKYDIAWYGEPDKRSYRVDFSKIAKVLSYKTDYTPKEGAKEIYISLKEGLTKDSKETSVINWYEHLLKLNPNL